MDIYSNEGKKAIINAFTPKTKLLRNSFFAFIFGGSICLLGELLRRLYVNLSGDEKLSLTLVSISLIFLASLLTALGVFDRIAKYSGAGTLVPITGFSNAITSEAIDSKSEGVVLGIGAKIFTVAGPVILYGLSAGVIYGIIYLTLSFIS
jgi:stage V sporulation protein AC